MTWSESNRACPLQLSFCPSACWLKCVLLVNVTSASHFLPSRCAHEDRKKKKRREIVLEIIVHFLQGINTFSLTIRGVRIFEILNTHQIVFSIGLVFDLRIYYSKLWNIRFSSSLRDKSTYWNLGGGRQMRVGIVTNVYAEGAQALEKAWCRLVLLTKFQPLHKNFLPLGSL